jgi:hypothetical protein
MGKAGTGKKRGWVKKLIIGGLIVLLAGAGIIWYLFTEKHDDTANVKTDYTVEAIAFIKEFEKDIAAANKKYAEKIIAVTGTVTQTEPADTTINIKMADTATGSYLIFAFQQQHAQEAKTLKPGDKVTIKGSCSDGIFSEILNTWFISFKRSALTK